MDQISCIMMNVDHLIQIKLRQFMVFQEEHFHIGVTVTKLTFISQAVFLFGSFLDLEEPNSTQLII